MRGHHHPLGWAAVLLIAVVYAHVLCELAAVVAALVVICRLTWPRRPWTPMKVSIHRSRRRDGAASESMRR